MAKRRALTTVTLLAGLSIAAITFAMLRDSSFDRVSRTSTIRIGYAVEPPFAFLNPNGSVTGESPELARAVAHRLGIEQIDWVQTDFDQLIPDLEAGRFDLIAAGMFITPERASRVSFSQPTFHASQGLLVRRGNPFGLSSYAQAATMPDVRIAVLSGSVEEVMLHELGAADQQLVRVPDAQTGRIAVEAGLADGLALSTPTLRWMLRHLEGEHLELAAPFSQPTSRQIARPGYGAFVFRKADHRLQAAWDAAMRPLIGSPEHLKIIEAYGFSAADLPGAITTEEVLAQ